MEKVMEKAKLQGRIETGSLGASAPVCRFLTTPKKLPLPAIMTSDVSSTKLKFISMLSSLHNIPSAEGHRVATLRCSPLYNTFLQQRVTYHICNSSIDLATLKL